jgi:hypothetical protein
MAKKKTYMGGMSAEERAVIDYQNAGQDFIDGGAAEYQKGDDLAFQDLGELDRLGPSGYNDIVTDSRYTDNEMEALRQLEEQSKEGLTARDRADMAKVEQDANRANRGRQGAIQQQMESRGLVGSGMEFALKQQAAQDAAEMEALSGLEKNAQMQDRKQNATMQLGNMSSQLQQRDFGQAAQKASAADDIARFNTQNSNTRQQYNTEGANSSNQQNWNRGNQVADNNTNANYQYRKDSLGVNQDNATTSYNYANDMYNRKAAEKAAAAKKKSGMGAAIGGIAGAAIGTYFAPGVGTAAGASAGSALGGSMFAHGGKVEGPEVVDGDDFANDIIPVQVSAGEIVIPKSHAKDPMKAAKFVAEQNGEELDSIGLLLEAMASLNKGKK